MSRQFLFLLVAATVLLGGCAKVNVDYATATIGSRQYRLEVADDNVERARGLSNRQEVDDGDGMLFVFSTNDFHSFWMKDTYIPLEIFWLDESFHVVDKKLMAVEKDPSKPATSYAPRSPARYAVEVSPIGDAGDVEMGDTISVSF